MPGLVDGHMHISFGQAASEEELSIYTPDEYRAIRAAVDAEKCAPRWSHDLVRPRGAVPRRGSRPRRHRGGPHPGPEDGVLPASRSPPSRVIADGLAELDRRPRVGIRCAGTQQRRADPGDPQRGQRRRRPHQDRRLGARVGRVCSRSGSRSSSWPSTRLTGWASRHDPCPLPPVRRVRRQGRRRLDHARVVHGRAHHGDGDRQADPDPPGAHPAGEHARGEPRPLAPEDACRFELEIEAAWAIISKAL
jgi:hypothetical protein